ncbi:MAG: glycosyltransferase family 4 protein [Fibrobacterota bacterium]|nr:glycosyltransferase family 4 protein [Fibrobacterota bacterium]QQS06210.1 MAG: glycosyltransferase family 4 protein [Fibrobacterota bacterium]
MQINDYPSGGGAEVHLHALDRLLSVAGHQTDLLLGSRHPIHFVSRLFNPWLFWVAWRRMKSFKPDIVHVHKYNLVWSIAPFVAARLLKIPVVCTQHDFGAVCPEGWMLRPDGEICQRGVGPWCFSSKCQRSTTLALDLYRRFNLAKLTLQVPVLKRTVAAFTAPSAMLASWVERVYPGVPSHALPLFIDPPHFDAVDQPDGSFTLFHAGRIEREKGLDVLIRGMASVPGVRLRIAGDGGAVSDLRALALALGIADRVEWLGKIGREQVLEECRTAHLAVLPSIWVENAPVFVLEAMREGCPVAASRVGGYPDLIEEGRNGFLVDRRSVQGWSDLLGRLTSQGFDRRSASRNAQDGIRQRHSPQLFLERLMGIYRDSLSGKRRS